jgi:hypothetical protein
MEHASDRSEVTAMECAERRLVLDRSFDEAVDVVLDAFIREGFSVRSLDGGDLRGGRIESSRRYALLDVVLPELTCCATTLHADDNVLVGCRLALFELTGSCTLLTAENPMMRFPVLADLVSKVNERIGCALRTVGESRTAVSAA